MSNQEGQKEEMLVLRTLQPQKSGISFIFSGLTRYFASDMPAARCCQVKNRRNWCRRKKLTLIIVGIYLSYFF
jgi:hypothetical protein